MAAVLSSAQPTGICICFPPRFPVPPFSTVTSAPSFRRRDWGVHENKPHIPYRDSVLTCLLADSLGGNSRARGRPTSRKHPAFTRRSCLAPSLVLNLTTPTASPTSSHRIHCL